jgi:Protein of unknown function (DUF3142)
MRNRYFLLPLVTLLVACHQQPKECTTPLTQQAYVWQRDWTPVVSKSVTRPLAGLDGLVVLGAQIRWRSGKPVVFKPNIDWAGLHAAGKSCGIALRIEPFAEAPTAETRALFADVAQTLIKTAMDHDVLCVEFQVDFDCPQKKLSSYLSWLAPLRQSIQPTRCVITTLPAWLDEPDFPKLLAAVDAFVLQVHSVTTRAEGERVALCDPARARRWVERASLLGRPFIVSLPTYSALVGYDESGRSLGMALDGVQPKWPKGTRVREFWSDPEEMQALVTAWKASHPQTMTGLIWYRLPVDSDQRNWRWPTFEAVIEGRPLRHELAVMTTGENPVDFSVENKGDLDEPLSKSIVISWVGPAPIASDALPGWTSILEQQRARFTPSSSTSLRLPPGGRRGIGWLRFDQRASLHVEISP